MKTSDYFSAHEEYMKEAFIFCAHKDINDYARYGYDASLVSIMNSSTEPYRILEEFEGEFYQYANYLIKNLEEWEEYEICDAVLYHRDYLVNQIHKLRKRLNK